MCVAARVFGMTVQRGAGVREETVSSRTISVGVDMAHVGVS